MPATEAQISANRLNAARSTGPKTEEGKARSRANSYKHGLTGEGIVQPEEDAAEVERLTIALRDEFRATGEAGSLLARQMATMAVRMQRSAVQESAALSERVRRVMDEFEAPEGVDARTAEKLRAEAGGIALFDPSKEACLARKYEAAACRSFFRALSDLRQLGKAAKAADSVVEPRPPRASSGSSLPSKQLARDLDATRAAFADLDRPRPSRPAPEADFPPPGGRFDVPITIGRRR